MTVANGLRVVEIAENHGNDEWIAVYYVAGSALRSRSFKTLRGAEKWARKQVGASETK